MRDSFVDTMHELLAQDKDVILLTGDLGFGIFDQIAADFPDRFINVGVAEQNMLGLAAGLSLMGKKVFCYSIANFSFMRGLEQFRNGAIYHNTNVTVVCSGGGFTYGQLGFTHFAIEDYGILSTFSTIEIHHPSTSTQVVDATRACAAHNGPSYIRLEKAELNFPDAFAIAENLGLHCHAVGERQAIVAIGSLLDVGMSAIADGAADNQPAVYSLTRHDHISDPRLLKELGSYDHIVVVEEHVVPNSVGQKLKAALQDVNVVQLAIADSGPNIVGDQNYLRNEYGITVSGIRNALI